MFDNTQDKGQLAAAMKQQAGRKAGNMGAQGMRAGGMPLQQQPRKGGAAPSPDANGLPAATPTNTLYNRGY